MPPASLKLWFKYLNLTIAELRERITLAANGLTLRYPLDITYNQNDRLLFLADPIVIGANDPIAGQRIELRQRARDCTQLNVPTDLLTQTRYLENQQIAHLRAQAGLPKVKAKYRKNAGQDILVNPEEAIVTSVKTERGFTYINLNGGDSWGYYFPENTPELVYNFKGEPVVELRALAPDFYHQYTEQLRRLQQTAITEASNELHIVGHDIARDRYFMCAAFEQGDHVEFELHYTRDRRKLSDYLGVRNQPMPDHLLAWEIVYDPTSNEQLNLNQRRINTFIPSPYMNRATSAAPQHVPPAINRLLNWLFPEYPEIKTHFLKWLAYILQYRDKTGTAWILSGTQGTGKGLLMRHVLQPLFGQQNFRTITNGSFRSISNDWISNTLLTNYDEAYLPESSETDEKFNLIKLAITEPMIPIRRLYAGEAVERNYVNLILTTNYADPAPLPANDRRLNIAPHQYNALSITDAEINQLRDELPAFAAYLNNIQVTLSDVNRPLDTPVRTYALALSMRSSDLFFHKLLEGDLDYFQQFIVTDTQVRSDGHYNFADDRYRDIITSWAASDSVVIPRDELLFCYEHLLSRRNLSPAKFSRMCAIHNLHVRPHRVNGQAKRGVRVTWATGNITNLRASA